MTRPAVAAVACFVLGTALLLPCEHPVTIAAGVVLLIAFVACGVFALATPDRLEE